MERVNTGGLWSKTDCRILEPAPYREIEQKIRQLETLRTYFLNNSKYVRNITRDIQSTEAAPKYSYILWNTTLSIPLLFSSIMI